MLRPLLAESRPGGRSAIARKAGVDRAGLHRALAGPSVPNWNTVTRVLRALNVDIAFQASGVGEAAKR